MTAGVVRLQHGVVGYTILISTGILVYRIGWAWTRRGAERKAAGALRQLGADVDDSIRTYYRVRPRCSA